MNPVIPNAGGNCGCRSQGIGMGGPGIMAPGGGMASDPMSGGGMFGAFQSIMMSMMSSLMAMMSSGMMGQLMNPSQGGMGLSSGQNPMFGGGGGQAPPLGSAGQGFTGNSAPSGSPSAGSSGGGGASGNLVQRPGGKLDSSIVANFDSMVAAAKKDGVSLEISSGHRSRAEQEKLYAAYKNGTGNLAAKPGTSNHEKGQAIDFKNTSGAYSWLAKNAERFGFKNLPGEPWHYSPTGT